MTPITQSLRFPSRPRLWHRVLAYAGLLMLASIAPAAAQTFGTTDVTGQIVHPAGSPAGISVSALGVTALTDDQGLFTLQGVPAEFIQGAPGAPRLVVGARTTAIEGGRPVVYGGTS